MSPILQFQAVSVNRQRSEHVNHVPNHRRHGDAALLRRSSQLGVVLPVQLDHDDDRLGIFVITSEDGTALVFGEAALRPCFSLGDGHRDDARSSSLAVVGFAVQTLEGTLDAFVGLVEKCLVVGSGNGDAVLADALEGLPDLSVSFYGQSSFRCAPWFNALITLNAN